MKKTDRRHLLCARYALLVAAALLMPVVTRGQTAATKTAQPKAVAAAADTVATRWWSYPLPGAKVISPYGGRGRRRHTGVDIKTKPNDQILAAFDGVVTFAAKYYGYGLLIRVSHPCGLETYYSHNSRNLVHVGDTVRAGQVIALTGQTGRATTPHLHFETRLGGRPINPATYFDHQRHTLRLSAFQKTKSGYVVRRK